MRKWTKTAGLLFLATSAVYSSQLALAGAGNGATAPDAAAPSNVRLLEAAPAAAADPAAEAMDPSVDAAATPASQPAASEGTSVTASQVAVSDSGTVEIHVNDASLVEVLRMLSIQSQRNIIASKEVRGAVTANLYDVTVREALDAILHANGYAYREKGNFIFVYSVKELAEIEKAERKSLTEVFRLSYTPAANAVTMIKPVLSPDAQVSFTAPAVGGIDEGGTKGTGGNSHATEDMIVVTDYADNIDRVRKILKEVDRRPQQILIEATILRAALTDDNALGVDFNIVGGVDFNRFITQANNPEQITGGRLDEISDAGRINSVGTGENFTGGTNGFRVGLLTSNVAVFLSALEQVTDTVVLANPKVLALNKQKGEVIVGRKDGYLTTTVTESAAVQTVEFLETGTRLIFRPFIGDDGYIRMEIHPEDSSGGLTADANLPFKVTTEVTSNVMIKDGNTVVIGGLFREDSSSSRNQVPLLGNIPVAGALFRKQRDRTIREEVIILLTPHIVKDDSALSAASEALLKDAEKLRVGVRKGMMPFGRERLAEWSYERAVAEMNKPVPDRNLAIWHLNSAIDLNPLFTEAINMRQELTGRQITASDNSSIRGFVRQQVVAERMAPPATQPAADEDKPAADPAAAPAEPATSNPVAVEPSTQPVAQDAEPEAITQTPAPEAVADVPATQPAPVADAEPAKLEDEDAAAVKEEPAAQDEIAAQATTAPAVTELPVEETQAEPAPVAMEAPAATQPAQADAAPGAAGPTSVTELPMEEVEQGK